MLNMKLCLAVLSVHMTIITVKCFNKNSLVTPHLWTDITNALNVNYKSRPCNDLIQVAPNRKQFGDDKIDETSDQPKMKSQSPMDIFDNIELLTEYVSSMFDNTIKHFQAFGLPVPPLPKIDKIMKPFSKVGKAARKELFSELGKLLGLMLQKGLEKLKEKVENADKEGSKEDYERDSKGDSKGNSEGDSKGDAGGDSYRDYDGNITKTEEKKEDSFENSKGDLNEYSNGNSSGGINDDSYADSSENLFADFYKDSDEPSNNTGNAK